MLPLLRKTVGHVNSTYDTSLPQPADVLAGCFWPSLVLAVTIFFIGLAVFLPLKEAQLGLRLNLSRSMPLGLYRLTEGPIDRGVLVSFCLEREVATVGRERGYLSVGTCAAGTEPLLKRVVAVAGDVVEQQRDLVSVNGQRLASSATFAVDPHGRALLRIPVNLNAHSGPT